MRILRADGAEVGEGGAYRSRSENIGSQSSRACAIM